MEDQEYNIVFRVIELFQVRKGERTDLVEYYDKDTKEMRMKKEEIPLPGMAKTEEEFQEVFKREFRNAKVKDKEIFRNNQIIQVQKLIEKLHCIEPVQYDLIEALTNYLHWLQRQDKPQEPEKSLEPKNEYPEIFTSPFAWYLFQEYQREIDPKEKKDLAEYSFIYRKMIYDGLIHNHIKNKTFIEWLHKLYGKHLDKIKTNCSTHDREKKYEGIFLRIKVLFMDNNWKMSK